MTAARFPDAVRAGPLIVTSGFSGAAAGGGRQGGGASAAAYAALAQALEGQGVSAAHVARLDHFTQSQGWLAERQQARAAMFGRPAPIASTGVATVQPEGEMLTVAAMAVAEGDVTVIASGADHAMPAIAASVRAGPFLLISGVLTDGEGSALAQRAHCLATIEALLDEIGLSPARLMRLDAFAASPSEHDALVAAMRDRWGGCHFVIGGGVAQFDRPGQIEVNALALADGVPQVDRWIAGGGVAVGGPWVLPEDATVATIVAQIERAGAPLAALARIELRWPRAADKTALVEALTRLLPEACRPALLIWFSAGPPMLMMIAALEDG